MHTSRRSLLRASLALSVAALLGGCGSDGGRPSADAPGRPTASGDGVFPATVVHKYGSVTVPSRPQRIVVVGLTEQDTVLQLGYTPVATTEWYGKQPFAVWPWSRARLGTARPTVLSSSDGFEYERIAELRPDLILGSNAGMDRTAYGKLSKLAPTIAAPVGSPDNFGRWDEQAVLVASALGMRDRGRQLVAATKERYGAAARANPGFRGRTATFTQGQFYGGVLYAYQPGLNTEFLSYLGLTVNPKLNQLVKQPGVQAEVSAERLDVIDSDVLIAATERPRDVPNLLKVKTFERLDVVRNDRTVYTDPTLAGALYFITPASLDYALGRLVPRIKTALAGDAPRAIQAP